MIRLSTLTKYLDNWCIENDACYGLFSDSRCVQIYLDRNLNSLPDFSGYVLTLNELKEILLELSKRRMNSDK